MNPLILLLAAPGIIAIIIYGWILPRGNRK